MLQESTTDTPNNQSKYGRRFDEEFRREVAAMACRPGAKLEQVTRDLGVSPWSVSRWKKRYGGDLPGGGAPAAPPSGSPGASVQELERRIKALERENADLRAQRAILSLNRSTGFLQRSSFFQAHLPGLHPLDVDRDTHRRQRLPLTIAKEALSLPGDWARASAYGSWPSCRTP